ncbi:MAG: NAD(P)H-dependent oxidoreductase subunit E [Flavobacteriales bacterium]|nr:NADH-quinone oxidoreductase chain 2 [Flavobacteriales bacterium]MCC6575986.1 NAD(P)H-dependent oxidoreductase subunit E [Flavobacteriales bacterium]NUQ13922.1 NAD(P)H-dependent oxidoreductase subunit E [Flavobacteriales bacterium]
MSARTRPVTTTEGVRPFAFSATALAECRELIARYPEGRSKSALIPILHIAQAENDGWLSVNAMDAVAELLGLRRIEVYEVASFYSMFNLHPVGTYVLDVCRTTPCMLRGSDELIAHLEKKLGIHPGETTKDGMFTLKTVECLGSCGTGPMLQCGARYHEDLTVEKVDRLIDELRARNQRANYTDR